MVLLDIFEVQIFLDHVSFVFQFRFQVKFVKNDVRWVCLSARFL
jgi:hypothetical protein